MTAAERLRTRATRRFYRWLFGAYRVLLPTDAPPGPVDPARVRRLLVARTERVGDLVVLLPTLSYLRAALPNAELDVVASAANASLLAGDPRVGRVFVHEPTRRGWLRTVRALRARRYDVVLTTRLLDHFEEGLFAALVAGRRGVRLTARRPPQVAGLFTHQVRISPGRRHVVARLLHVARALAGDADAPASLEEDLRRFPPALRADPAAAARVRAALGDTLGATLGGVLGGRPYVALNAWGRDPRRSFEPAYAAEVAAAIIARRPALAVVLTPPPGREHEAYAIARDARARTGVDGVVVVAPPSPDLADLVALLRAAAVVVTPDTANVHLASALDTPLVAVYTPLAVAERDWGAWGARRRVVRLTERRPLRDVPVAAVADACAELWDEVAAVRGEARDPAAAVVVGA